MLQAFLFKQYLKFRNLLNSFLKKTEMKRSNYITKPILPWEKPTQIISSFELIPPRTLPITKAPLETLLRELI